MNAPAIDPARVRDLTRRLVACSSVSPDPGGEAACAALIRDALPRGVECGLWPTDDGRPVVWAHRRGRSPATVVLLAHYDTVGVEEYAALDPALGARIAFDPEALRERLLSSDQALPKGIAADVEEERRTSGTWMFGRGSLDMKSGVAAGVAALESLVPPRAPPEADGHVILLVCPDEENQSAGMRHAVEQLVALRDRERLELVGAINLDYTEGPVAYEGMAGKLLVGIWVLGDPSHVGNPFAGADAVQMSSAMVMHLTTGPEIVEREYGVRGVPPVALHFRDRKLRYDVQTAREAEVELNVITYRRSLRETLEALRTGVVSALRGRQEAMAGLAAFVKWPMPVEVGEPLVLTYPELLQRAGGEEAAAGLEEPIRDPRRATFERVRALARSARVAGPAVVLVLLPPFYPHSGPTGGPFGARTREVLGALNVKTEPWYPFISDACYLAWRPGATDGIETLMPSFGVEYRLPVVASRSLNLEVVNLGPWGRDAHGLYERVHAPYAFGILPGLIARSVMGAWAIPAGKGAP